MGKSDIRKRSEEIWPEAWYIENKPDDASEATLVVIDAMQTVKGLNFNGKTWRDLAERMLADLKVTRDQYPRATTFIYSFDKYPFVPIAKAPVQIERSMRASVGEPEEELAEFVCGPLDAHVPDEWTRAVGHRAKHLREIIRFFVKHWMTFDFPEGITVIVDGHYLKPEDVPQFNMTEDELLKTPLYLCPGDARASSFLANDLGEGDFAMPFLMDALSDNHSTAIVLSIDTDLMSILLSFDTKMKIFWRYWPRLSFMPNTNGYGRMVAANAQKWCDVSILRQSIENDQRLLALKDPVLTLSAAIAASGGDYVDPIERVTPQRFIDTLLVNAKYIGDICNARGEIEAQSHQRLIRCACVQAVKGNRTLFEASKHSEFTSRLTPSPNDMLHRRHHLQYYMSMLRQAGHETLKLDDPRMFGYARINRDKDLSRNNIKRLHGNDVPDDALELGVDEELEVLLASEEEVVDLT